MSNGVNFKDLCIDLRGQLDRVTAERDDLQQRLTETDQRADDLQTQLEALEQRRRAEFEAGQAAERRVEVLDGLVRRSQDFVAFVHKCVRRNGEYAPLHRQEMDELNRDLSDYVEPGAPVCEQCRGEGRVGGPAPDEGGGKNCPACDGTGVIEPATEGALKPAEGGGEVNPSDCTAGHPGSNCDCELCRG